MKKTLKLKSTKFGFAEEKYLITDIILEYWSMGLVIKTETALTWFYSCNKIFVDNELWYCLHWMWTTPPASPVGVHCFILNSLAKKGLINVGFVISKTPLFFFLSSLLPPRLSFLFFLIIQLLMSIFHL